MRSVDQESTSKLVFFFSSGQLISSTMDASPTFVKVTHRITSWHVNSHHSHHNKKAKWSDSIGRWVRNTVVQSLVSHIAAVWVRTGTVARDFSDVFFHTSTASVDEDQFDIICVFIQQIWHPVVPKSDAEWKHLPVQDKNTPTTDNYWETERTIPARFFLWFFLASECTWQSAFHSHHGPGYSCWEQPSLQFS